MKTLKITAIALIGLVAMLTSCQKNLENPAAVSNEVVNSIDDSQAPSDIKFAMNDEATAKRLKRMNKQELELLKSIIASYGKEKITDPTNEQKTYCLGSSHSVNQRFTPSSHFLRTWAGAFASNVCSGRQLVLDIWYKIHDANGEYWYWKSETYKSFPANDNYAEIYTPYYPMVYTTKLYLSILHYKQSGTFWSMCAYDFTNAHP